MNLLNGDSNLGGFGVEEREKERARERAITQPTPFHIPNHPLGLFSSVIVTLFPSFPGEMEQNRQPTQTGEVRVSATGDCGRGFGWAKEGRTDGRILPTFNVRITGKKRKGKNLPVQTWRQVTT